MGGISIIKINDKYRIYENNDLDLQSGLVATRTSLRRNQDKFCWFRGTRKVNLDMCKKFLDILKKPIIFEGELES